VTSPSKKPLVSPKAASTISASYAYGRAELRTPSMEATITGYTKWLLHKDASSCFLTIRHSRGRYQNRSWRERSYAKVEGLAFSVLDCESSCWLAHYVRGFGAAAANCSAGARAGGIGHAGAHGLASNHRHGCSYAPSDHDGHREHRGVHDLIRRATSRSEGMKSGQTAVVTRPGPASDQVKPEPPRRVCPCPGFQYRTLPVRPLHHVGIPSTMAR